MATISRLLKIIGLLCKRALQKRQYFPKDPVFFSLSVLGLAATSESAMVVSPWQTVRYNESEKSAMVRNNSEGAMAKAPWRYFHSHCVVILNCTFSKSDSFKRESEQSAIVLTNILKRQLFRCFVLYQNNRFVHVEARVDF